jgi:general stress protein YciG
MKTNSGDSEKAAKTTDAAARQTTEGRKGRGFASMDEERQREIASMGGKAAHQRGTAHEFTPEEAREAGAKGGKIAHERGTAHEFTPEEAREAGRKGGQTSARTREAASTEGRETTRGR